MMKKKLPLEGYRIVDFGWVWAGTVLGHILADYGAETIKVESKRRLDGLRLGRVFEVGTALEVNPTFHNLNRNKLSITVDMQQPKGVDLLKSLISKSDVVVENYTPDVMKKRGLDYESLIKVKPDIIMISMRAAGDYGPLAHIVTYAPIITALSGIDSLVGYADGRPLGFRHAYADPTASLFGAFAILGALRYKKRTGKGQYIDLSQWEATTGLIGEAVMDYTMNKRVCGPQGNRHASMAPHGNYPCKEKDTWVSIAVKTEEEWAGLCKAMGNPVWAKDHRFIDKFGRLENSAYLDQCVAKWTSTYTDYEAAKILQKQGVAAAPLLVTEGIFADPHFNKRNTFVHIDHPVVGAEVIYNLPWKLSGCPTRKFRHAPLLGEHNKYVFGQLLGLSDEEIAKLIDEKVIY
jgi:benzylsuccinate CoA-transferase BbsF subunit